MKSESARVPPLLAGNASKHGRFERAVRQHYPCLSLLAFQLMKHAIGRIAAVVHIAVSESKYSPSTSFAPAEIMITQPNVR